MASRPAGIVIALTLLGAGCTSHQPAREYELRGQVLAVDAARQEVTIKHEDIPRFMPAMTMTFRVASVDLLADRVPGDLVKATLVVGDNDVHLKTLERTGFATVREADAPMAILGPGGEVADATFVDDSGATRHLADWRGHVVAVTFIYTRCPLPNFCPLMDRHFKAVQDRVKGDASLAGRVRLLSVSFDPAHDTPQVLSRHAKTLQADPSIWRFVTGEAGEIERFAKQFGVSVIREDATGQEIVHNLRTAVIDGNGRLVTILNGGDWTPPELVTHLRAARAAGRSA